MQSQVAVFTYTHAGNCKVYTIVDHNLSCHPENCVHIVYACTTVFKWNFFALYISYFMHI